jgi:hypothetical protein
MHDRESDQRPAGTTRRAAWAGLVSALAVPRSADSQPLRYTRPNPTMPSPPPSGTLRASITIPDTYTRHGVLQQAAGTYVFDEANGTRLGDWVDPDGRFTMTKTYCRVPGCLLRVYFCHINGGFRSVEFRLGDWQGTGLGKVLNKQGWPITLNLNRYSVVISDASGATLMSRDLTGNRGGNIECAHGWHSGWRWTSWTAATWPYKRSIVSLRAKNLIPAMSATAVPQYPYAGPGPFTYPPAQPPNYILGMHYTGGITGTSDSMGGMMMAVDARYIMHENVDDLATMMAVADSAHNFPIIALDDTTEAIADMWHSNYRTEMYIPNQGGATTSANFYTIMDVLYTNTTNAPIDVNNMLVVDSATDGNWYPIYYYWWTNPTTVVPANGSLICTVFGRPPNSVFSAVPPAGTASLSKPVTGLSVAWAPSSLVKGAMTSLDPSHNNPHSWLVYLVTGDPYFLEGAHGLAVNAGVAMCGVDRATLLPVINGVGYRAAGRYSCWGLRDYLKAALITPDNAPKWVMPKASFQKTVDCVMHGMRWFQTATTSPPVSGNDNLRQMFRIMLSPGQTQQAIWQEDYAGQVMGECSRLFPGTLWDAILDWWVPSPIARLNGISGWCNATPTGYNVIFGQSVGNWCASWKEAWDLNVASNSYPACTTANDMVNRVNSDYLGGLYAAIALAVQAGQKRPTPPAWLDEAIACKGIIIAALHNVLKTNPKWAFSPKQGYA